jgi:hypothetical protein
MADCEEQSLSIGLRFARTRWRAMVVGFFEIRI